jgi:hypothetical protein
VARLVLFDSSPSRKATLMEILILELVIWLFKVAAASG